MNSPKHLSYDDSKAIKLQTVQLILNELTALKKQRKIRAEDYFRLRGHTVTRKRIRVSGGVGAIQWMNQRKVWRIQIHSADWSARQYKYALCIEV